MSRPALVQRTFFLPETKENNLIESRTLIVETLSLLCSSIFVYWAEHRYIFFFLVLNLVQISQHDRADGFPEDVAGNRRYSPARMHDQNFSFSYQFSFILIACILYPNWVSCTVCNRVNCSPFYLVVS